MKILKITGIAMIIFALIGSLIDFFKIHGCLRDVIFYGEVAIILMGYVLIQEENISDLKERLK